MTNPVSQVQRPNKKYKFTITHYKQEHFFSRKDVDLYTLTLLKIVICSHTILQ
jgi:hypothetical protein